MTEGPEYLDSDLVDVSAVDLATLGSLDPNLLAASLEHVLRRVRRPAEAIAGFTVGEPFTQGEPRGSEFGWKSADERGSVR